MEKETLLKHLNECEWNFKENENQILVDVKPELKLNWMIFCYKFGLSTHRLHQSSSFDWLLEY